MRCGAGLDSTKMYPAREWESNMCTIRNSLTSILYTNNNP